MDKLLILDSGSTKAIFIGKLIREFGVYCEIIPWDTNLSEKIFGDNSGNDEEGLTVRGIIVAGSADSVKQKETTSLGLKIKSSGIPVLNIQCDSLRMIIYNGGEAETITGIEASKSIFRAFVFDV